MLTVHEAGSDAEEDMHIVLLGDSIFDNARYTGGEPDVVSHLRRVLPAGAQATLVAVDGSITTDLERQIGRLRADTTHVVLSIGGNDALMNSDLLTTRISSTAAALALFADRVGRFEQNYRGALDGVAALRRPTTVCTIYNGNLEPEQASLARIGLMLFNDVVLRVAFERRVNVIDLRLVCNEPSDYANAIEPSGSGGLKIARAIARAVGAVDAGETSRVIA